MYDVKQAALNMLYSYLKASKIALGRAENRPGVTQVELDNLKRKIDVLEWLTEIVLKEV